MPEIKPFSEMHGITDEKLAREYISVITKNVADQAALSAMIAVEWGIEPAYMTTLLNMENERAQKDMILESIKYLASKFSDDTEDEEDV